MNNITTFFTKLMETLPIKISILCRLRIPKLHWLGTEMFWTDCVLSHKWGCSTTHECGSPTIRGNEKGKNSLSWTRTCIRNIHFVCFESMCHVLKKNAGCLIILKCFKFYTRRCFWWKWLQLILMSKVN